MPVSYFFLYLLFIYFPRDDMENVRDDQKHYLQNYLIYSWLDFLTVFKLALTWQSHEVFKKISNTL